MSDTQLFNLVSNYEPAGDQVNAIAKISSWLEQGVRDMTIHGITGSGKTFTMANIIAKTGRPALIYSPNKILAYQLYEEIKAFFPDNEVHYYVSTFDLYRPEFVKFGEFHTKQSVTNDLLMQMSIDAAEALSTGKRDVIIVASSSCLFGTGSPEMYKKNTTEISTVHPMTRQQLLELLYHAGYSETINGELSRGAIINRTNSMIICSHIYEDKLKVWELKFDPEDYLEKINFRVRDRLTNDILERHDNLKHGHIFPATRFAQDVYTEDELDIIAANMMAEAKKQQNSMDPDRYNLLIQRIEDDLNSIRKDGYCNGIENYAWYFNRKNMYHRYNPEDYYKMTPYTIMSYLHPDTLMFIDESHLALGQIEGAAAADLSRKIDLIDAGIRLPSCVINRPLTKSEVRAKNLQTIYVSATPRTEEKELSGEYICPLFIRPTYLLDPDIELVYVNELEEQGISYNQHVITEIATAKQHGGAVLLRCPSSKVCRYYHEKLLDLGFKAEVMLAETPAPVRREMVERLQATNPELDHLDVIIGVNLIREGLDIPRVEKVLIVDAHVGGFLNDTTSLIQVIGRAARNANGKVFIYLNNRDKMTPQIQAAVDQTLERRALQQEYNRIHNKTPKTAVANSYLNNIVAASYDPKEDDLFSDDMLELNHELEEPKAVTSTKTSRKNTSHQQAARDMVRDMLAQLDAEELEEFTDELIHNPHHSTLDQVTQKLVTKHQPTSSATTAITSATTDNATSKAASHSATALQAKLATLKKPTKPTAGTTSSTSKDAHTAKTSASDLKAKLASLKKKTGK